MAQSTEAGDAAHLARALAGDRDAFRVLVERHSRSLFRLAYRMTGNEQDAEEVVQDAFLRAYRWLDQFESRSNFGTWLYRIAMNCSLDLLRKRRPHEEHAAEPEEDDGPQREIAAQDPPPDRLAFSAEIGRQVEGAMLKLSAMERAAFVMRHHDGKSIEEIGQALGLSSNATKNSIFRAVQKLRHELHPLVNRTR
jgi:RNA polymerase sigma-70 factor, ECF subfamily